MQRQWLQTFREQSGMSQEEVATHVEITRQYYGMIENGIRNPSVDVAQKLGALLNFNWIIFFEDEGNRKLHKNQKPA